MRVDARLHPTKVGGGTDLCGDVAGTHLYMLMAPFPGTEEWREEDVNRFFESFKLSAVPQQ